MKEKPKSKAGYSMKSENKSNSGGYQAPSSDDNSVSGSNFEEGVSLFDIRKAGHPVAAFFTFIFKLAGILRYIII